MSDLKCMFNCACVFLMHWLLHDLEINLKIHKKKLYGPFLWMGFNCRKATEPLQRDSLLFNNKPPKIPGTHLSDLRRMKGWLSLGATQWF